MSVSSIPDDSAYFSLLMRSLGVSDSSQPVTDPALKRVLFQELVDLRRVTANLTSDRERQAAKAILEERKRDLELVTKRAEFIQELDVLKKNIAADREKAAFSVQQKAAEYVADTKNKLYRPDMARFGAKLLGATNALDRVRRLVGDPILEQTTGALAADETVYAQLRLFGERNPNLFSLKDGKVILGSQLQGPENAVTAALRTRVEQTYPAFAQLEKTVEQSEAVRDEMKRIQNDAAYELNEGVIAPAVDVLLMEQSRVSPEQLGAQIRRSREKIEKGDRELSEAKEERALIMAALERGDSDRVRTAFAKAVNNPFFRQWAESNGFDIGTSEGTAASYREGRDDVKAAALFALQERTGMRLAKRRGRTVALPEELVETQAPLTEDQEYMSRFFAEGDEDKPARIIKALAEGKPTWHLVEDTRPESDPGAYLELLPDGSVVKLTRQQVDALEDEGYSPAFASRDSDPAELSEFAVSLGNIKKARTSKEATRRSGQVYTEIRLTPEDLRQRRRRLLDEETGEVIEVPLDTKLDVLEDIRVPITRRIGEKADERFFARQRQKADQELLREEELPRPPERTDMEEEAIPDVEGLPSIDDELEEELAGGFDITTEDGQVDLGETTGKRAREVALQRAAETRARRASVQAQDDKAVEIVSRTREDELKEEFDARVATGMSRKKAAEEAVKAVEAREAAEERRLPTEAERQKAREGMPGVTADPTAIPRFAGTERAAKRPGRGDVSLGRPMPSALEFKLDGTDVSYDPKSKAFSFEDNGKIYRFEPGSKDPGEAEVYDDLQKGLRKEKPGIFFTGFPTIDATLPEESPATPAPASEPFDTSGMLQSEPFDLSGMSRLNQLRMKARMLREFRQANQAGRKLDKAKLRAGQRIALAKPRAKFGQVRKRLEEAKESREAATEDLLSALDTGSMQQAEKAQKSTEKALKREQRLAERQGKLEERVEELQRTDPQTLGDKQKQRQKQLTQVAKMQAERQAQATSGGD